jgi:hypothetical protein
MLRNISEFHTGTHAIGHRLKKRDSVFNFGGVDKSQMIKGSHNTILETTENPSTEGQETLLRKTAHKIGRIFESGGDLATAPAQWLKSMQQNWYEFYE